MYTILGIYKNTFSGLQGDCISKITLHMLTEKAFIVNIILRLLHNWPPAITDEELSINNIISEPKTYIDCSTKTPFFKHIVQITNYTSKQQT